MEPNHNHRALESLSGHPGARCISDEHRALISQMSRANRPGRSHPSDLFITRDITNMKVVQRKERLHGRTSICALFDELKTSFEREYQSDLSVEKPIFCLSDYDFGSGLEQKNLVGYRFSCDFAPCHS